MGVGFRDVRMRLGYPGFCIPMAWSIRMAPTLMQRKTVTDLGTEFGVEVDKQGATTSHVFRGTVRVQVVGGGGKSEGAGQVLRENESARVECRAGTEPRIVLVPTFTPSTFVREIPKQTIKVFDLVDVVAGGDGFSGRRNRGIDPITGQIADTQPLGQKFDYGTRGGFHRVPGLPFVDGVFTPDGRTDRGTDRVQVDSAGHIFVDFCCYDDNTSGYVWAGGFIPTNRWTIVAQLDGVDYSRAGHGVLALFADKGITFDLDAIRRVNPGGKLLRFCAVVGNIEPVSAKGDTKVCADAWVLVDGQVRFQRRRINGTNGSFPAKVPLADKDRYLTLVGTDGGNVYSWDWIVFCDPRLELAVKVGSE